MICKLCEEDRKLVKSHIIPKSFYSYVFSENEGIIVSKSEYAKRVKIGVYDRFLCDNCEKKLSAWDDYGNKFFHEIIKRPSKKIKLGYIFNEIEYGQLKLFLMSVLWRAGACNHDFFSNVGLGPFDSLIRTRLLRDSAGGMHDFSMIIKVYDFSKNCVLQPPQKVKFHGINAYRLYFFNSEVLIKVDKRNFNNCQELILSPNSPLIVTSVKLSSLIQRAQQ